MARLDVEAVKAAARGRWPEILSTVGGIDRSTLSGGTTEHPCPKCGGKTRFRLIDAEAGAVLCSHCFTTKNGDGIAAVQWALGVGFGDALKKIAEFVGVKAPATERKPDDSLTWIEWSETLIKLWLHEKPGIVVSALHLAGARMARHRTGFGLYTVATFPVIGSQLDMTDPVNYVAINASGGTLPTGTKSKPGDPTGKKVVGGKARGLVGKYGVERLLTPALVEVVWKVEGLTDLLALQGIIPEELLDRHVVVTSAFGSKDSPEWMAGVLAKAAKVYVLHDADEPGEVGARLWCREVSKQKKEGATLVKLPYPIQPTRGKDLRDFILEGHTYDSLLELASQGEQIVTKRDDEGNQVANERVDTHFERAICRALQIEVLGELDGKIKIYSNLHHKTETINDVSRLTHEKLMQLCGPPAKEKVHAGTQDVPDVYKLREVKEAIALVAGYRRIEEGSERGAGIWQGRSLEGKETHTLVLVNARDAARFNGDRVLRRVNSPRADGLLLDLSAAESWYDFDNLSMLLKSAENPAFCEAAIQEATELFGRWRWRHQESSPLLMAGLVMASWVQTIWPLRPLVAIEGATHSGKSKLFECLGGTESRPSSGLFGWLALLIAKPSEAGLRQEVGGTGKVLFIDEFESSKERDKVLAGLRTSKDGTRILRGSASGKSSKFGYKHIAWVAAIECGLTQQPDRNRYIQFELMPAIKGKQNQLKLPTVAERNSLGMRLAAIAMVHVYRAIEIYDEIREADIDMDARTVEIYSVPAAIIAAAGGLDATQAIGLLKKLLGGVDIQESKQSDADDLLADIMSATIQVGGQFGQLTVGQLLEQVNVTTTDGGHSAREHLEKAGIKVVDKSDGIRVLFISPRIAQKSLLRFSEQWNRTNLKRLLMRLPGATAGRQRLSGPILQGVELPESYLDFGDDSPIDPSY